MLREILYGTGEEFEYWHCAACGCLQIVTIPDDLSRHYPSSYYAHSPERLGLLRSTRLLLARAGRLVGLNFLRQKDHIRPLLVDLPRRGGRVVDVGCGNASLLQHLSRLGCQCTAVDPFVEAQTIPRGIRFLRCSIEDVGGRFDTVLMIDSLEHMPDPHQALANVARLLRPEGVAILRLPVLPNIVWDEYGANWLGLDPPRHLYTFTVDALRLLAQQHGLTVQDIGYDGRPWLLTAARAIQEGTSYFTELSPEQRRPTHEDIAAANLANHQGRGDSVFVKLRPTNRESE